jgi:hypothetical protein
MAKANSVFNAQMIANGQKIINAMNIITNVVAPRPVIIFPIFYSFLFIPVL